MAGVPTKDVVGHSAVVSGTDPTAPKGARAAGAIGTSTPLKGFFFSWVSVCVAETITLPTDTVKTRMQVQGELGAVKVYRNSIHAATTIAKTEGVAALWKGLGPALVRQSVYGTFRCGLPRLRAHD